MPAKSCRSTAVWLAALTTAITCEQLRATDFHVASAQEHVRGPSGSFPANIDEAQNRLSSLYFLLDRCSRICNSRPMATPNNTAHIGVVARIALCPAPLGQRGYASSGMAAANDALPIQNSARNVDAPFLDSADEINENANRAPGRAEPPWRGRRRQQFFGRWRTTRPYFGPKSIANHCPPIERIDQNALMIIVSQTSFMKKEAFHPAAMECIRRYAGRTQFNKLGIRSALVR